MESGLETKRDYDLIVIGTGNAGMAMSVKARHAGLKVAVTDELPYGGTCAVKGCIPKKILIGANSELNSLMYAVHRIPAAVNMDNGSGASAGSF